MTITITANEAISAAIGILAGYKLKNVIQKYVTVLKAAIAKAFTVKP